MKQDQEYSNDTMCRLLSVAESYSLRVGGKNFQQMFKAYDSFEGGKVKSIHDLRKQFLLEIEIFKESYDFFVKNYRNYSFPQNLSLSDVKNFVTIWQNNIKFDEFYEAYNYIFRILNGDCDFSLAQTIEKLEADDVNANNAGPNIRMIGV